MARCRYCNAKGPGCTPDYEADNCRATMETLWACIKEREAALRPFAEAYRTMKETGQAIGARHCAVEDFQRAHELIPPN